MPVMKVNTEDIHRKLFTVFVTHGYDGSSMEMLSEATGLKKASLYHRFPGGKKEMAEAVLRFCKSSLDSNITEVVENKAMPLNSRLRKVTAYLNRLYSEGYCNCILRMLSTGSEAASLKKGLTECMDVLINGFTVIASENGFTKAQAKSKGKQAVLEIQGALILTGITSDKNIFKNTISGIPGMLSK